MTLIWLNSGIYLNVYRDPQYDLRYIPYFRAIGLLGLSGLQPKAGANAAFDYSSHGLHGLLWFIRGSVGCPG